MSETLTGYIVERVAKWRNSKLYTTLQKTGENKSSSESLSLKVESARQTRPHEPYPRRLYKNVKWMDEYGRDGWSRVPATSHADAEVVSSEIGDGIHCITIDVDYPTYAIPSSTDGHFHLYIDYPMTWRKYKRLLKALAKAGVVEEGYVDASIRRKHTAVRVPWRKKHEGQGPT